MMEQRAFLYRIAFFVMFLTGVAAVFFTLGIVWSRHSIAEEKAPRVIYPKKTKLDFEGLSLEGELNNPAEFYFENRPQEKFDSLVKRRKNFHREMLRDTVMSR